MNIVSRLLRRVPKRLLPMGIAVAAIVIPAAVMAWGPGRPTYTMAHPADHVTFDSITDNPAVGDERNFLAIQDANNTAANNWQSSMTAQTGHEYVVRMYVHNDAASNLNLKATNVRTKVNVPTTTGKSVELGGFITSDNAAPQEIWSSATLTSTNDFNVAYEAGSAHYYNNVFTNGIQLSDNIVTNAGAQLGYDKLDGIIPGCTQYSGYVYFKVKIQGPQQPTYTFTKDVRMSGSTSSFAKTVGAQPGDKVDFRLSFKNTGDVALNNVVLKDQLPAGLNYVAGTAKLYNSNYPSGYALPDALFNSTGDNIGNYATSINAFVVFTAQVAGNDQLPVCGPNTLHNVASSETDFGNKQDTADVTTSKTCVTPPTPSFECSALTVDTISRTQFKFTASSQVKNAQFEKYTFVVRDAAGNQLASQDSTDGTFTYTQTTVGKYSVQATVVVLVNGQEKTATSDNCKKAFEVTQPPIENKYVCSSLTSIRKQNSLDTFALTVNAPVAGNVQVKEYNFNFGDNQSIIVGVGQETQTHTYAAPGTYTATVTVTFDVNGKTITGVTSDNCATKVTVEQPPVTPPATPSKPTSLPDTGSELATGGLFGSGAVGLGINSWLGSRRKVRGSFKR